VRASAEDARLRVIRSEAEAEVARKAGDRELAARHEQQAERSRCPESAYRVQKNILAGLMDDRRAWEAATEPQRRLANTKPKLASPNYECHDDRGGGSGDATNVDDRPVVVPGCRLALARRRAQRGDRRGRFAIASSVTQALRPVGPDGEPVPLGRDFALMLDAGSRCAAALGKRVLFLSDITRWLADIGLS
jgi:hypothetical protein